MHRPDARTVSFTRVHSGPDEIPPRIPRRLPLPPRPRPHRAHAPGARMSPASHARPWCARPHPRWAAAHLAALAASHLWQSLRNDPAAAPQPQPATTALLLAASPPPADSSLFHLPFPIDNTLTENARRLHWSEAGQAAALADF